MRLDLRVLRLQPMLKGVVPPAETNLYPLQMQTASETERYNVRRQDVTELYVERDRPSHIVW